MTFPQTHMWDAPFCPTAFDSCVDLDGLCDQLTDGLWENNFNLGASKTVSEFCECSISSLSAWGGQISVPNFEKSGVRKKYECLEGACYIPCQKRLCKTKYDFKAQFQVLILACFSQTTN